MTCLSPLPNHPGVGSWTSHVQDSDGPCPSPSRDREVELWRRNQNVLSSLSEPSLSAFKVHPNISLPSGPPAFVLNTPPQKPGLYDRPPIHRTDYRPDPTRLPDLDRLRHDALTELQRSVVETGEGFVDKMRVWENYRQQEPTAHRGPKRSHSVMACRASDPMDDSDDVMIVDSALAEEEATESRKKRTFLIDGVDDINVTPLEETPRSATDDDTESCSHDSVNAILSFDAPFPLNTPTSHPDKAVSALTLAFASGMCDINDYQAVLDAYSHTHYGEESHVGELWG